MVNTDCNKFKSYLFCCTVFLVVPAAVNKHQQYQATESYSPTYATVIYNFTSSNVLKPLLFSILNKLMSVIHTNYQFCTITYLYHTDWLTRQMKTCIDEKGKNKNKYLVPANQNIKQIYFLICFQHLLWAKVIKCNDSHLNHDFFHIFSIHEFSYCTSNFLEYTKWIMTL